MTPYDRENETGRSDELAKRPAKPRPQLFDIEKSDAEFFGGKKNVAPPQAPVTPPQAPVTPPQAPAAKPPIVAKKNVYRPNSFADLPPDVQNTAHRGPAQPSEPTRIISRQAIERQVSAQSSPSDENVKIYDAKSAPAKQSFYGSMPQQPPARPAKPFKLNIADEDYNAIPDFDNRNRTTPRSVESAGGVKRPAPRGEFDYVPPNAQTPAPPQTTRANKTMRSLGRLANGIIYTVGILFASILLSVFILQSMSDVLGLFKSDKEISISIPQNANTQDVAAILKESGVIAQPLTFRLYSKYREYEDVFLNGGFTLNSSMSYDEIFSVIQVARNERQVVSLTFIEGMTVLEIAQRLEENNVCDAQEFIHVLNTTDFGYEFEDLIPTGGNRYLKLEGYLFPDTYSFYVGESPNSAAKKFLANFNRKITADLIVRIEKMGMTLDEALTLASIVQKEGRTLDDMYMVSSVFNNRLNKPKTFPLLQSDVTINYVNDNIFPFVSNEEDRQAYASVYNTYKCEGLPVGPVANPGINAIKAAIYPDDSPYYYFLTDIEMRYYYATNLTQHEVNLAKAKQVGDTVGGVNTHTEE